MAATDDSNPGPGSYTIEDFNIISSTGKQTKDITKNPWYTINLVESMGLGPRETQFMSGEVVIIDAIGLYKEFALHGNEVIEFKFKTPQKESISFKGRIYQIGSPLPMEGKQALSLKFCSAEKYVADQFKWSIAFKQMTYSDMVRKLFGPLHRLTKKTIFVEDTLGFYDVVIPNWSVSDSINWISRRCVSGEADHLGMGYVFYERADGVFVFSSVDALMDPAKNEPVISYTYEKNDERGSQKNMVSMTSYDYLQTPNHLKNINGGMYSSTLISNDLIKRKHQHTYYNYIDEYAAHKHVNPNVRPFGQGTTMLINDEKLAKRNDSAIYVAPKHSGAFGSHNINEYSGDAVNPSLGNDVELILLRRNSQRQQINNIKIRIVVPGDSQRRVGEIVYVTLPTIEPINSKNPTSRDPFYSGRYLISRIKHTLMKESETYETIMELVKDSYTTPLPSKT